MVQKIIESTYSRSKDFMAMFVYAVRFCYFKPARKLFWGLIVFAAGVASLPLISAKVTGVIVDTLTEKLQLGSFDTATFNYVILLTVLWAFIDNFDSIFNTAKRYIRTLWTYRTQIEYELKILEKRIEIDSATREQESYRNLEQHAFEKGPFVAWNLAQGFFRYWEISVGFLVAAFILGFSNFWVLIILVMTALPQLVINIKFGEKTYGIWTRKGGKVQRLYYYFRSLIGTETLELNNTSRVFYDKVEGIHRDTQGRIHAEEKRRLAYTFASDFISLLGVLASFLLIVLSVLSGAATIGALIFLRASIYKFSSALEQLIEEVTNDYEYVLYTKDLKEWFAIKPFVSAKTGDPFPLQKAAPLIEFKNVSFSYPGERNKVLKNVNLTIQSGERIALIGNNGAGKSSLIKLLLRIYDPTEGEVTVNGKDIKTIKVRDWRANISALLQEYLVFNMKTKESIWAKVNPDKGSKAGAIEAATASTASDFIDRWDDKYEEQIGKEFGGKELSRGQKQKLSLASTLYRDTPILILDEPTSAIDSESELSIFKALEKLPKSKTIVFVSHDMAVVRNADRIIVLKDGVLIEDGSHAELFEKKGYYSRIYSEQVEAMTK